MVKNYLTKAKYILGAIAAIVLIVGMSFFMTNTVKAGDPPQSYVVDGITFDTPYSDNHFPTASGNYYLTDDVTFTIKTTYILPDTNLYLNGHKIIINQTNPNCDYDIAWGVNEPESSTIGIYGTGQAGEMIVGNGHPFAFLNGGTLVLSGVTLTNFSGGAVVLDGAISQQASLTHIAALEMRNGAKIINTLHKEGNYYNAAVAIRNGSSFYMRDGEISNAEDNILFIEGNKEYQDVHCNIYGGVLKGQVKINSDFGSIMHGMPLSIKDGFNLQGSSISIKLTDNPVKGTPWVFTNGGSTVPAGVFAAATDDYLLRQNASNEWELYLNNFSVTYDANGGADLVKASDSGKVDTTVKLAMAPTTPPANMRFAGWNTKADGSGQEYAAKAVYTFPEEDITLYAQWLELPKEGTYDAVSVKPGEIQNITGSPEATLEDKSLSGTIENADELMTLLDITEEEIEKGVNVWVDIKDASDSISDEDKALITDAKGDSAIGMYIDVSLYKKVADYYPEKITETNGKVKISFVLPESLIKDGREFKIIRVHNGEASVIEGTYDAKTRVFTFETDEFSSYAIAYTDAVVTPDTTSDTTPTTGDSSNVGLHAILLVSAAGVLSFALTRKLREE